MSYRYGDPTTAYERAMIDRRAVDLREQLTRHQMLEPLRLVGMMRDPRDRINLPTIQEMVEKYPRSMTSLDVGYDYDTRDRAVEVRAMFDVTYRMPRDLHEYLESLRALKGL